MSAELVLLSLLCCAVEYLKGAQAKAAAGACPVTLELIVREKGEANKPNNERLIAIIREAGVRVRVQTQKAMVGVQCRPVLPFRPTRTPRVRAYSDDSFAHVDLLSSLLNSAPCHVV